MTKDTYKTLSAPCFGEFKDRGSKFLAYATPLSIETDFSVFLEKVKKEHPKARHHCFAWRLGLEGNRFRANDDGEPSGTAGRPILGQIDSFELTNIGVVVARYFGGTLLGTSGLIQAYRAATAEALRAATIVEKFVEQNFEIRFCYEKMPEVMNALKRLSINILSQQFDTDPKESLWEGIIQFSIRQRDVVQKLLEMRALILKISAYEAQIRDYTEGVKLTNSD